MEKLDIGQYFHGISSSEHVENGKPDPAVYLSARNKLQVDVNKCIAFENSVSGVLAAKSEGIKAVVVPPAHDFDNLKYKVADLKLRSLLEFDLNCLTIA
jgi:sugar-phosphatase